MNPYISFRSIKLRVNIFAFLSFGLMLYAEGVYSFFVILSAAVLHETGHLAAVRICRGKVTDIEIQPFGALISYASEGLTLQNEIAISMAGIMFNLVGAFIASMFINLFTNFYLLLFIFSNLFFAMLNLIPIPGNDGSNTVFYAALIRHDLEKAEKIKKAAALTGRILLFLLCCYIVWISNFNNSLFAVSVMLLLPRNH